MRRQLKIVQILVLGFFVLVSAGLSHAAQWANPDLLLTAEQVNANISKADWVVIDCRDLKDYAKGHIPGSISLGKDCGKALRDATSRTHKDVSKYETLLGKVGVGNDTHVVFVGEHKITDTMKATNVGFWILEYLGHDKAHVLNGGLDAWLKAGYKLTNEPTMKPEKKFKANVVKSRIATTDEVYQIATGKLKGVQLIDSRTKEEHNGDDMRALRGGHIPNTTINVSHDQTFDQEKDPKTGKDGDNGYLSPDRVASMFNSLDKNKRTIGYCQTGSRSTITYLELRLLGFKDPANYDDSWVVWGNNPKYPAANEQWYNFENVKKIEKSVKKLEEAMPKKEEK